MESALKNVYWLNLTAEQEKKFFNIIRNAFLIYGIIFSIIVFSPEIKISPLSHTTTAVQVEFTLPARPTPQPILNKPTPTITPEKITEYKQVKAKAPQKIFSPQPLIKTTQQQVEKKPLVNVGLLKMKNQLEALKSRTINTEQIQSLPTLESENVQENINLTPQTNVQNTKTTVKANYTNQIVNDTIQHESKNIALYEATTPTSKSNKPISTPKKVSNSRSEESVRILFEKNKTAFFTLYNRALRQDASLQGKVVFKVTIEASGKVSQCIISSSDLTDKDLQNKLIAKIKGINFGAMPGDAVTINYSIDFFPG